MLDYFCVLRILSRFGKNLIMRYYRLLLFIIGSQILFAQPFEGAIDNTPRTSDSRLFDAFSDLRNRKSKRSAPPKNIKGTYYFESRFLPSEVTYFGEKLRGNVLLRYNAYNDELEIGKTTDQKDTEEILLKSAKVEATINGEHYRLVSYRPKEDSFPQVGYLVVLSDGDTYKLYLQRKKVFMDAVEARTGLERSFPARFVDEEHYFYQIGDETPLPLKKSKTALKKVFQTKGGRLKEILKDNKLKTNNSTDLRAIFEAMNASK